MYNSNFIVNLEDLCFILYTIKIYLFSVFTFYISQKISINRLFSHYKFFAFLVVNIFICFICAIIKNLSTSFLSILVLFIISSILYSLLAKNTIGFSMIVNLISTAINYIFLFFSITIFFIFNLFINITNDLINLIVLNCFHMIFIFIFFKIRRFKNGFSFLKIAKGNEYFDISILNITVLVIFFFALLSNDKNSYTNYLIFSLIISIIIMFITIQKTLTLYYKQKLMKQQIEETNKELENKDKIIEKLQAENINFSKISHSIAHRQKSLEYKLDKLISSKYSNTNLSSTENLKSEINKISEDYLSSITNIKTIPDLQKTGIPKIDDMLSYMQSECFKNKINFILNIKGNIYYMTNHYISVDKLEILLADFIKNSIIAITCSKNINRTILLVLGYVNSSYELCISDTGIEFEIDTLRNLGCTATTTHKDTGGTGYGFMNTFDTLREFKASLVIEEIGLPNISNYTKSIKVIFDNKNEFIIRSYRYNEMKNLQFNSKAILEEL